MLETYNKEVEVNGVKTYRTYTKIENVKRDPNNPRDITDDKAKDLDDFISKYGELKPVLVDIRDEKLGQLIGGNKRLESYLRLGKTELWINPIDPMTDAQAFEIGTIDNMEFGHYVEAKLMEALKQYKDEIDFSKLGVHLGEIPTFEQLMKKFNKEVVEDEAPEVSQEPAKSELGKVYQLGRHRLMCGDATKIEDVEKLMNGQKADMVFTDPPYGLGIDGQKESIADNPKHNRKEHEFRGWDNERPSADLFNYILALNIPSAIFGGNYFADLLPVSRGWIYWGKGQDGDLTSSDGELAWTNLDKPLRSIIVNRGTLQGSVHPTQKPIEVVSFVLKYLGEGINVLDLFGGSGSTLIACEQTNRTAFLMEIDNKYTDVIMKRWMKFTGKRAYEIKEENGKQSYIPVVFADESFMESKTLQEDSEVLSGKYLNTAQKNAGQSEPQL